MPRIIVKQPLKVNAKKRTGVKISRMGQDQTGYLAGNKKLLKKRSGSDN